MASTTPVHHRPLLALLLAPALACAACNTTRPDLGKPYPAEAPLAANLDVHALREVNRLRLTNTSGVAFGPATVWINAAYSLPIDGLAVNQRLDLPLNEFRNEYGQTFRGGGFFASELPSRVVKAEVIDERGRFGLVVVRDEVE
jgi:hypothetical protein